MTFSFLFPAELILHADPEETKNLAGKILRLISDSFSDTEFG
jgi:hypothetical protein